jgi:DNA-binding NarL/FixJ family response regulator
VRVALRARSDLVSRGLVSLLEPFRARIQLVQAEDVQSDIALFEAWTVHAARAVIDSAAFVGARGPVLLSPCDNAALIRTAVHAGARGFLSPRLDTERLVEALERVHRGEVVVERTSSADRPEACRRGQGTPTPAELPGGLSRREVDVLVLVAEGRTNSDIAAETYLSPNTVKSYLRNAYRKIGATNRVEAVIWAVEHLASDLSHGLAPVHADPD